MKLVIFDIDGTLTNTKKVDDKCFKQAFWETFGIDLALQEWETLQHVTDWGICEEIFVRERNRIPTAKEYEQMNKLFVELLKTEFEKDATQFTEIQGAKAFFTLLAAHQNFVIGVATGGWEASALFKLTSINIDIEGIPFSHSNHHKSRVAITNKVIQDAQAIHNQAFDEILYFGDGIWDFKTCQALDIRFIGIDAENNGKLAQLGVDNIFENYLNQEEIIKLI